MARLLLLLFSLLLLVVLVINHGQNECRIDFKLRPVLSAASWSSSCVCQCHTNDGLDILPSSMSATKIDHAKRLPSDSNRSQILVRSLSLVFALLHNRLRYSRSNYTQHTVTHDCPKDEQRPVAIWTESWLHWLIAIEKLVSPSSFNNVNVVFHFICHVHLSNIDQLSYFIYIYIYILVRILLTICISFFYTNFATSLLLSIKHWSTKVVATTSSLIQPNCFACPLWVPWPDAIR